MMMIALNKLSFNLIHLISIWLSHALRRLLVTRSEACTIASYVVNEMRSLSSWEKDLNWMRASLYFINFSSFRSSSSSRKRFSLFDSLFCISLEIRSLRTESSHARIEWDKARHHNSSCSSNNVCLFINYSNSRSSQSMSHWHSYHSRALKFSRQARVTFSWLSSCSIDQNSSISY